MTLAIFKKCTRLKGFLFQVSIWDTFCLSLRRYYTWSWKVVDGYASHEMESRTTYASPTSYSKMLVFSNEGTKKAGTKGRFRVSGKNHETPQIWGVEKNLFTRSPAEVVIVHLLFMDLGWTLGPQEFAATLDLKFLDEQAGYMVVNILASPRSYEMFLGCIYITYIIYISEEQSWTIQSQ